jgi:hypothetical protein
MFTIEICKPGKVLLLHASLQCNILLKTHSITTIKGKGKASPLQASTGPESSRRLRRPDFKTIGTWRWQGCQTYTPAAFTPRKYLFLVLISFRGRVDARVIVQPEGKNPVTPSGIELQPSVCRAVPQPLRHHEPPNHNHYENIYVLWSTLHFTWQHLSNHIWKEGRIGQSWSQDKNSDFLSRWVTPSYYTAWSQSTFSLWLKELLNIRQLIQFTLSQTQKIFITSRFNMLTAIMNTPQHTPKPHIQRLLVSFKHVPITACEQENDAKILIICPLLQL